VHEAALAEPLLRLVLEECERHATERNTRLKVTRVLVRAGVLMAVEAPTLRGIFAIMAEGTPAEGAELAVETHPMTGLCPDCASAGRKAEVSVTGRNFHCPCCGNKNVDWQGGNELYIASLSVQGE
jgi:Zn finger protein HypA/HybF (possibly regulating hydrogenase expression)